MEGALCPQGPTNFTLWSELNFNEFLNGRKVLCGKSVDRKTDVKYGEEIYL